MATAPTTELRSVRLVFESDNVKKDFESLNNLEIFVPDSFGRKSLRKTIGQLLKDSSVDSLDFAIEGILLRTTLGKFCEKYEKSREKVLEILCFEPEAEPKKLSSASQGRWLSCLQCVRLSDSTQVVAGDAEGFLSGWNLSDCQFSSSWETLACEGGHHSTVIGIDWLPSKHLLVSCLQTGVFVFGTLEGKEGFRLRLYQPVDVKKNSVESFLFYRNSSEEFESVLLGTFKGSILRIPKEEFSLDPGNQRKEKNLLSPGTEESLHGHSLRVSSLVSSGTNVLSSSWDGTVKIWDLNKRCLTSSTNIGRAVNSLSRSLNQEYFIAGNMDGSFTLLDSRQEKPALRKKFAHSLATTAVTCSPCKNHLFCTAGRDNKVKIWDSRALSAPYYESVGKQGNNYVTCLFWDREEDLLLSGSSGGELVCLSFEDARMQLS